MGKALRMKLRRCEGREVQYSSVSPNEGSSIRPAFEVDRFGVKEDKGSEMPRRTIE